MTTEETLAAQLGTIEGEIRTEAVNLGDRYQRLIDTKEYLLRAHHALSGQPRLEEPTSQERHRWQANEK